MAFSHSSIGAFFSSNSFSFFRRILCWNTFFQISQDIEDLSRLFLFNPLSLRYPILFQNNFSTTFPWYFLFQCHLLELLFTNICKSWNALFRHFCFDHFFLGIFFIDGIFSKYSLFQVSFWRLSFLQGLIFLG